MINILQFYLCGIESDWECTWYSNIEMLSSLYFCVFTVFCHIVLFCFLFLQRMKLVEKWDQTLNFALGAKQQIFQSDEHWNLNMTCFVRELKLSSSPDSMQFSHSVMFLIWMNMPLCDKSTICSSAHAVCWLRFWLSHCLLVSCLFTLSHMKTAEMLIVSRCVLLIEMMLADCTP